ncbi:MAG: cytochrome b/b6 domain-containing protein [Burkholderiaceae bacterium]|nr:cytochrome b/b6 domain-containing protein [Burkholderiaceae bacterium]
MRQIRIWDLPTRLFHWTLVGCVVGLVISGNIGGNAMVWHFRFGHTVLGLLLFRIVWGLVGGYWSRFSNFIYSPATVLAYLKGERRPQWTAGHNPLGAFSVFALLTVLLAQVGSGMMSDDEIAAAGPLTRYVSGATIELATRYHTTFGKILVLALVALHIAAIIYYWRSKKENLVRPMIVGDKSLPDTGAVQASRDSAASRLGAAVLLAASMGCSFWIASLGA